MAQHLRTAMISCTLLVLVAPRARQTLFGRLRTFAEHADHAAITLLVHSTQLALCGRISTETIVNVWESGKTFWLVLQQKKFWGTQKVSNLIECFIKKSVKMIKLLTTMHLIKETKAIIV